MARTPSQSPAVMSTISTGCWAKTLTHSSLPSAGNPHRRQDRRRYAVIMTTLLELLRQNRNYRYTWMGQVVSEIGDHFNNIAVFSLAVQTTHSGMVVSGVLLARAIPAVLAGPLAGVTLDRLNRKQ